MLRCLTAAALAAAVAPALAAETGTGRNPFVPPPVPNQPAVVRPAGDRPGEQDRWLQALRYLGSVGEREIYYFEAGDCLVEGTGGGLVDGRCLRAVQRWVRHGARRGARPQGGGRPPAGGRAGP